MVEPILGTDQSEEKNYSLNTKLPSELTTIKSSLIKPTFLHHNLLNNLTYNFEL